MERGRVAADRPPQPSFEAQINQAPNNAAAPAAMRLLAQNVLVASIQLPFWLLLSPSRWRMVVQQIDPALTPDFALAELRRQHWRNPALQRLLLITYGIWPLHVGLIILIVNWLFLGRSLDLTVGAMLLGISTIFFGALSLGTTVSFAGGLIFGLLSGLYFAIMSRTGVHIVGYGVSAGITGGMLLLGWENRKSYHFLYRRIGSFTIGILVSTALLMIALTIASGVVMGIPDPPRSFDEAGLAKSLPFAIGGGGLFCLAYILVAIMRTKSWYWATIIGLVAGLFGGSSYGLMLGAHTMVLKEIGAGIAGGLLFSHLFAIPYVIILFSGGKGSGSIAGALISGLGWAPLAPYIFTFPFSFWHVVVASSIAINLGLIYTWWLPRLLYPFEQAWNTIIYRLDRRRMGADSSLLEWNSAFWDEYQSLRLYGLENHLVLTLQRQPAVGEAALNHLNLGLQRWAVQAAELELIAQKLTQYNDLETIARTHRFLASGKFTDSLGIVLKSLVDFSKKIEVALNQTTNFRRRFILRSAENDLIKLERELLLSSEHEMARFHSIVHQWRKVANDYVSRLESEMTSEQEIDNPYIFGVPLTDEQEIFVGRLDVSARIEQLLSDYRRPPLLLYGQRRMGKTSLLYNLGRLLPADILPLFVDGQRISGCRDYADFLYNLVREMVKSAAEFRSVRLPSLHRQDLEHNPFTCFNEWLDEIEYLLVNEYAMTALLALDEFETIEEILNRGRFDEVDIMNLFRHLIQHRTRFKVLLASSYSLDKFKRWSGYLINMQVIKIDYLKEEETRQLIEHPIAGFTLRYEPNAVQRIFALTHGHPALVQLLCYELVELKNQQPTATRNLATVADVEAAIPRAIANGSFFFSNIENNQLTAKEVTLLHFLAGRGEQAVTPATTLQHQFPSDLDAVLAHLLEYQLLTQTEGGYRFQVELIRCWFAKTYHT